MVLLNKLKNSIFKCYRFINLIASNSLCAPIIETFYTDFWNYRNYLIKANKGRTELYNAYLERSCASIGLKSIFKSTPITPHGLHGIHISDGAILGQNITIMQNVTIGSSTLRGSKRNGAPHIGDNVFIGANSSIIGGIKIGNNCRIGANCCIFFDVADNQTVVIGNIRCINHDLPRDNKFMTIQAFEKNNDDKL